MKTLDRHILRALVAPFLLGLLLFAIILLADVGRRMGASVLAMRVPPELIVRYLLLRVPSVLALALPVGMLIGSAMSMNRLTRSGETAALRAGCVSFWRIAAPVLAVGVLASGVDLALNEAIVPRANERSLEVYGEMILVQPLVAPARNVPLRGPAGHFYYLGRLDPATNTIENVVIQEPDVGLTPRRITVARRATYEGRTWTLMDGCEYTLDEGGELEKSSAFTRKRFRLQKALQKYLADRRTAEEMRGSELRDRIRVLMAGGGDVVRERIGLQFKYAIPLACFVFTLIAVPLGHHFAARGGFSGVLVALGIGFLYNGVMSWTKALGLAGVLHPVPAAWLQNVLFGAVGLWLMRRVR
ncbi:MAG: LptF/LptG family permease [Armatimonadota bacterium]|jgi:lipopolysaccharide export system permease protein